MYDIFGVGVGEALKLVLVQIHNEELVRGRQLHCHLGELLVKVADITPRFLPKKEREGRKKNAAKSLYSGKKAVEKEEWLTTIESTKMTGREGGEGG